MLKRIKFEYSAIALYVILGTLWIIFSDKLLNLLINDAPTLTRFQTYKGWFYVLTTALIFYHILKNHLVKLRRAERKAKESDDLKTAFIQNISHEIRTPMNSIIGFSELVKDESISEEKRTEYLRIINVSSMQLLNVVNSIIDISMIQTGNLHLIEKKIHLNELIDEEYLFFQPMINKDISFTSRKGLPDNQAIVITDESKLRKIISNILNNAMKFTEKGLIEFGYTLKKKELEFYIEDTGIGIPDNFMQNIFNRFNKADNNSSKFYEGLGLGLSICKGYIDLLSGKFWVTTKPGKGSKFYFTIPYKPVEAGVLE